MWRLANSGEKQPRNIAGLGIKTLVDQPWDRVNCAMVPAE